ncbi:MAG: hypothetical protein M1826_006656 [Phylliscum demangeonii]|nr:MAG: hypothetical protein M1826_006656 [Phylliscum demangeonii]
MAMLPRWLSTLLCLLITLGLGSPAVSGLRARGRRAGQRAKDPHLLTYGYLVLLNSQGIMMGCVATSGGWATQGSCLHFAVRYDPAGPPGSKQIILESHFATRFCGIQRQQVWEPWTKRFFSCDFRHLAQAADEPVPQRTPLALVRMQHGSTLYFENVAGQMEATLFHLDPRGEGVRRLYVAEMANDDTVRAVWSSHPAPALDLP